MVAVLAFVSPALVAAAAATTHFVVPDDLQASNSTCYHLCYSRLPRLGEAHDTSMVSADVLRFNEGQKVFFMSFTKTTMEVASCDEINSAHRCFRVVWTGARRSFCGLGCKQRPSDSCCQTFIINSRQSGFNTLVKNLLKQGRKTHLKIQKNIQKSS